MRAAASSKFSREMPETASMTPSERPLPWLTPLFRLFGSHQTADKVLVGEVKGQLRGLAVDLFVAHDDIKPSTQWVAEIERALGSCDALAAFLTPDFRASDWCDQEVGFAMQRGVLIVPVCRVPGLIPYGFMSRYQGLKAHQLTAPVIAEHIFEILIGDPLTAARMSEAIVGYTAEAASFDHANHASTLLARVPDWTPELLRRLEESLESNRQVAGAYKASSRIRTILGEHAS
jgi:hypothetical protein